MSESAERQRAKAKEDTRASGAEPRLGERVREHGWRPTHKVADFISAARRRAIEAADNGSVASARAVRRPQ